MQVSPSAVGSSAQGPGGADEVADEAARSTGDLMVAMGTTDLDPIAVAVATTTKTIPTRIALVKVLMTQRPMSRCMGSTKKSHLMRGRRGFLPLRPNTRLRKPCTGPRSRQSEWKSRGPTRRMRT